MKAAEYEIMLCKNGNLYINKSEGIISVQAIPRHLQKRIMTRLNNGLRKISGMMPARMQKRINPLLL